MESEYLKKYASKVLEIKGNSLHRDKEIARLSTILNNTFTNVYKAVAFDVDGTLTRDGSTEIDKEMAKLLGKLLIKSVPVLLISGRGRGSMKVAVKEIIDKSKLSMGYFKRLSCIAHNGVYWLKSSSLSKSNILNEEIVLVDVEDIKKFHSIEREIKNSTFRIYFENSEMSISKEPLKECYLLRITIKNELIQGGSFSLAEFRKYLKKIVEVNAVSLTEATYGENYLFNISNTDKITALEYYAKTLGIRLKSILRIGDQGQAGGNDFDLLNSGCGFSVNQISKVPTACFPVLDQNFERLKGAEATRVLLDKIKLFPSLNIEPEFNKQQLDALREFEKLAANRSRSEGFLLLQKIRIKLHRLLDGKDKSFNYQHIEFRDIFDSCGGIKIKDWEINEIDPALKNLFGISDDLFSDFKKCRLKWAMFTDTNLLLRGPYYYWGLTSREAQEMKKGYILNYINVVVNFISRSTQTISIVKGINPSFINYKMILGIIDNVRNILLIFLHAVYISETKKSVQDRNWENTKNIYFEVSKIITYFNDALLDEDNYWTKIHSDLELFLSELPNKIEINTKFIGNSTQTKSLIRAWREADNFIENVIAVRIGVNEFKPYLIDLNTLHNKSIVLLGLDYGGLELPIIASVILKKFEVGIIRISVYGNKVIRDRYLNTTKQETSILEETETEIENMSSLAVLTTNNVSNNMKDTYFVIMDDNCTTARTLEGCRDLLIKKGAEVVGAIIVRYPGVNRYQHMLIENHGHPDPDVLLSFVRGFVNPSPYTRLLKKAQGENPYLDEHKIFDKSRERIEKHLKKNGDTVYS